VEHVVGVKVTRLLSVGRRLKDLEHFLDSNESTVGRALETELVRHDTLRLLRCVVTGGDVAAFERSAPYTIPCVVTQAQR
jgi:hypothetical protein